MTNNNVIFILIILLHTHLLGCRFIKIKKTILLNYTLVFFGIPIS